MLCKLRTHTQSDLVVGSVKRDGASGRVRRRHLDRDAGFLQDFLDGGAAGADHIFVLRLGNLHAHSGAFLYLGRAGL